MRGKHYGGVFGWEVLKGRVLLNWRENIGIYRDSSINEVSMVELQYMYSILIMSLNHLHHSFTALHS
jgi:hypothetical protein